MTDISDDYDPYWDDDREPEPDDEAISRYEHERVMRGLSPLGRVRYRVGGFIRRHTWRWRLNVRARWLPLTGRPTTQADEPPF